MEGDKTQLFREDFLGEVLSELGTMLLANTENSGEITFSGRH